MPKPYSRTASQEECYRCEGRLQLAKSNSSIYKCRAGMRCFTPVVIAGHCSKDFPGTCPHKFYTSSCPALKGVPSHVGGGYYSPSIPRLGVTRSSIINPGHRYTPTPPRYTTTTDLLYTCRKFQLQNAHRISLCKRFASLSSIIDHPPQRK